MSERDAVKQIHNFNDGREPERLEMKYARMAEDPFIFFRGTCHLFYEDLSADRVFEEAPAAWICGDLHLENFGSYKGDNGLAYFDLNDFDEAGLAPVTWELARFLTSLWLAAEGIGARRNQILALEQVFLNAYTDALLGGKARWVERDTTSGMIRNLLKNLQGRKAFLNGRTDLKKGRRKLKLLPDKTLPVSGAERKALEHFMQDFAQTQENSEFFELVDVARRIAGTGSLGIRRYVLLVEGNGSPDRNYLLDLKQARPSALAPYLGLPQPAWKNDGVRTVDIQRWVQAVEPALLQAVDFDGDSWILRELQPSKDRLELTQWNGKLSRLERVVKTMGEVVAWGQLRSGGRQHSAVTDSLMAFAAQQTWRSPLVDYAESYSEVVNTDWRAFCKWWHAKPQSGFSESQTKEKKR